MSEFYAIQVKKAELKAKEIELNNLTEEYDAISKQLKYTTNEVDRIRLKRQREDKSEEMDKVSQQCEDLKREIDRLRLEKLDEDIKNIVQMLDGLGLDILKDAYQKSVPDGYQREIPEKTNELILELAELTGDKRGFKPIWYFVNILRKSPLLDANIKQRLKKLLQEKGLLLAMRSLDQSEMQPDNNLMVKVKYIPSNESYSLEAKLVIDRDPFNIEEVPISKDIVLPAPTNSKYSPNYSKEELPQVLGELIKKCGGTPYKIADRNLTVQLFLPIEMMSLPIEHKQYSLGRTLKPCIGERCHSIVVRCYDRHFPPLSEDYEGFLGNWEESWRRYSKSKVLTCQEALHPPSQWKSHPKGVGSKFVEFNEQDKQLGLWDQLLVDGIPIALWVRQPVESTEEDHPIMQTVINNCCLEELPVRLSNHRHQNLPLVSNVEEAERVRAAPLCLLWDNPFRPFNTIAYEEP